MGKKYLLVEGNDDQDFFNTYCQNLNLKSVEVIPPKALNISSGDGWANLINNLPILLSQVKAGDIDNFGIIIDADFPPENNGGFGTRHSLVSAELQKFGYNIPAKPNYQKGEIFTHNDGLPNIGLWIMPNHKDDGMLEDFVASMIHNSEQTQLLAHAESAINNLPVTLFDKQLRITKAKIFTWRAWQKRPGLPLNKALNNGILDSTKAFAFEAWVKKTLN